MVLKFGHKCLERFGMWYWRKMEKIIWTDRVRNGEVLRTVEEKEYPTLNKQEEINERESINKGNLDCCEVFDCHRSCKSEGNRENSQSEEQETRLFFELLFCRVQVSSGRGIDVFSNFEAV
jgi:hypothetical protein